MSKIYPSSIILVPISYGRESSWGLKKGVAHKASALCGARYYDPDVALWISVDPARQYWSPYAYCGSNPINCIDFDGRWGNGAPIIADNNEEGKSTFAVAGQNAPNTQLIKKGAPFLLKAEQMGLGILFPVKYIIQGVIMDLVQNKAADGEIDASVATSDLVKTGFKVAAERSFEKIPYVGPLVSLMFGESINKAGDMVSDELEARDMEYDKRKEKEN
jgi:hypothetical protein